MTDELIKELVYRTCLALDAEDFEAFIKLCSPSLQYRIMVNSPDIRREMTWFEQDYEGMKTLLAAVPHHVKRLGTMKRHVSVYLIDRIGETQAAVTSSVLVTTTDPEGRSKLFVAGSYFDRVDTTTGTPMLAERRVDLETRDLGVGTHIPI